MTENRNNNSRNRRPKKRSNNNSNRGGGRGNNNNRGRNNSRPRKPKTPVNKLGGRDPVDADAGNIEGPLHVNAFELFCTYHLGITPKNTYKKPSVRDVARYFDRSPKEIDEALANCGLDNATCKKVDFDFSFAQLDIRVAPDGLDLREIARPLFEEFVELNPDFVDWSESKISYSSEEEE